MHKQVAILDGVQLEVYTRKERSRIALVGISPDDAKWVDFDALEFEWIELDIEDPVDAETEVVSAEDLVETTDQPATKSKSKRSAKRA